MSPSASPLNLEARRAKDVVFGVAYLGLFLIVGGIAVYSYSASPNGLANLSKCANSSSVVNGEEGDGEEPNADHLVSDLVGSADYLIIPLVGSILLGFLWMALLRYAAKPVVYATLLLKGFILIGVGAYLYSTTSSASCTLTSGDCGLAYTPLILIGVGVLYFAMIFCMRNKIQMTAHLIEQSVAVVTAHPGLFLASAGLLIVKIVVLCFCAGAYVLVFAKTVVVGTGANCSVQVSAADEVMFGVITVFLYWSIQLWMCMRFYVVSLTTGVWYYQNESLAAQEGEGSLTHAKSVTAAPVCTGLRLAFTKSFGSIAFASLIIAICEWLRRLARRQQRDGGIIGCLVACCINCILAYLEFLTRFALTFHALTGDDFCTSGKTFLGHCRRHGWTAIMVDYLAAMTLQFGAVILGLLITAGTVFLLDNSHHVHTDDKETVLVVAGVASWFVASVILIFIAGLLLNVVDAAYACLVLDLDRAAITGTYRQPALAQAVIAKAHPTYVIQQPGGGTAIAQPVQPYPQSPYSQHQAQPLPPQYVHQAVYQQPPSQNQPRALYPDA